MNDLRTEISRFASRARLTLLAGGLAVAVSTMAFTSWPDKAESERAEVKFVVDERPLNHDGINAPSFAPVVKKVAPSVVKISVTGHAKIQRGQLPIDDPFFRRFFGEPREGRSMPSPRTEGMGSGVIVNAEGYILTNNHVVDEADEVKVTLLDGRDFDAKVVGKDAKTDIAVLKIEGANLPYLPMADSDQLQVGDISLAVGNPFGIGQTVTMGIISATGRATLGLDYEDFIQTDAAINPGNSGGALVDAAGRLIGINTAILSRSGGNQGIGFAVPVNLARMVMESLIEHGRVVRGFLGIMIQDVNPALAEEFKVKSGKGALIGEVTPNGPAAKAGLQSGDVITQFNGKEVVDSRQLRLRVASTSPGTKVPVKVLRSGKEQTINVVVKDMEGAQLARKDSPRETSVGAPLSGLSLGQLDPTSRRQFNIPPAVKGVLVTDVEPERAAADVGIRPGDVVQEVNRKAVTNEDEAFAAAEKGNRNGTLLRIWSRGGSRFVVLTNKASKEPLG